MSIQQIFEEIKNQIEVKKTKNKSFVIGINGVDTSGKTSFTLTLNKFLIENNYETQIIHIDDFHNSKAVRYSGDNQAENYYNKSFNLSELVTSLLLPMHKLKTFSTKLTHLNLETDKFEIEKEYKFTKSTIVLIEGVFLFRKELKDFIDFKIFIDVPITEVKKRAIIRDVPNQGKKVMRKYDEKYIPAQERYLLEYPPKTIADLIIDNSDWNYPKLIYKK